MQEIAEEVLPLFPPLRGLSRYRTYGESTEPVDNSSLSPCCASMRCFWKPSHRRGVLALITETPAQLHTLGQRQSRMYHVILFGHEDAPRKYSYRSLFGTCRCARMATTLTPVKRILPNARRRQRSGSALELADCFRMRFYWSDNGSARRLYDGS